MSEHLILPDTQVKAGVPIDHLGWIGQYIVDQKPDVIVHIGDHWDFPSLSSYDFGKKAAEGRRVLKDFEAGCAAWDKLWKPLEKYNARMRDQKGKQYKPDRHFTEGNHEERVDRAHSMDAKIDGLIPSVRHYVEKSGVKFHKFLKICEIDGVCYSHYFYNSKTGRPIGGENLLTRLNKLGFSFTMGHQQGYSSCIKELNNGKIIRGLVAGSCYLHDEDYIGPQGNGHWRGLIYKHEVFDGNYDLMEVSLDYLCRRYEGIPVSTFMEKKYPDIFYQSQWLQRLAQSREKLERAA